MSHAYSILPEQRKQTRYRCVNDFLCSAPKYSIEHVIVSSLKDTEGNDFPLNRTLHSSQKMKSYIRERIFLLIVLCEQRVQLIDMTKYKPLLRREKKYAIIL